MSEPEPVHGPSGWGTVVLELGDQVGALILYTPAGLDGREIDITGPVSTHSLVRRRGTQTPTCHAAVYPSLPAGGYKVHCDGTNVPVTVSGGQVAICHWPT